MPSGIVWTFEGAGLLVGVFSPLNYLARENDAQTSIKIAAFDLDGTIIRTKSGAPRSQNPDDWELWDSVVPTKMQEAYNQGFTIKIITNQGRLTDLNGNEAPEASSFKQMIEQILGSLNVPLSIYVACANDNWRKPRTGIWDLLTDRYQNEGKIVDRSRSFLVGDAAGRASDHADADFHYSVNLGIGFYTPEQYFLDIFGGHPQHKFDPSEFLADKNSWTDASVQIQTRRKHAIVLIGGPGAGKTYFFKQILSPQNYHHVSQWKLGSRRRCEEQFESALESGSLVVIDDINASAEQRRVWLSIAHKHNVKVTAIFFNTPLGLCLHNDTLRAFGGNLVNPEGRGIFPRTSFLKLMKDFEKPSVSEGFEEVLSVDFQWMGTNDELQIWQRYWD
ncbi:PNK3P-domain-containing protein [Thozetella sp. PMI_491]|nr:PNK3P-domain-containing protein [Thozetella sp. PMI_491]